MVNRVCTAWLALHAVGYLALRHLVLIPEITLVMSLPWCFTVGTLIPVIRESTFDVGAGGFGTANPPMRLLMGEPFVSVAMMSPLSREVSVLHRTP